MLIVLLVQLIGGEINEEKTTRSMEVIRSNVSSKVHLYSKIVANNLFVIMKTTARTILTTMFVLMHIMVMSQIKIVGDDYTESLTGAKNYYDNDISFDTIFPQANFIEDVGHQND